MIESVVVDEMRARLDEDVSRAQFKKAPDPADERLERALSSMGKESSPRRRLGGMSLAKAAQIERDMEDYDSRLAKGGELT